MFTVTVDVTINRPVEEVFSFIAEAENDPKWCPSVKEMNKQFQNLKQLLEKDAS